MSGARRLFLKAALAICLAGTWLFVPNAYGRTVHETDQSRVTGADFSYTVSNFQYSNLKLAISRAGQILRQGPVPTPCAGCAVPAGFGQSRSVHVRDLDRDGEPEVVLDLYTNGAHCCFYSYVYRYDPAAAAYSRVRHMWGNAAFSGGNGAYRMRDLDRNGGREFVTKDDSFAYVFTDYADSFFPIQIWKYRAGRFGKVTRRYRSTIARDARSLLHWYRRYRSEHRDIRGALAAYTADMYLLHRSSKAWRQLRAANRRGELGGLGGPQGTSYLKALKRFLRHRGYAH